MPGQNLTRVEAAERAALVRTGSYDVTLDLTSGEDTFRSTTTARFSATPGASTFIDLIAPAVHEITLNGRRLEPTTVPDQDGGWKQGFAVGPDAGELVVTHTRRSTATLTYTIWTVWALTLVAALPLRRGKEMAS